MPSVKVLKEYMDKTAPWPWTGNHSVGFGVQIPEIIQMRDEHGDYIKRDEAVLILMLRDMLPLFISVIEAGDQLIERSVTRADILADGSIDVHYTKVNPDDWSNLYDALKAFEDKKNG